MNSAASKLVKLLRISPAMKPTSSLGTILSLCTHTINGYKYVRDKSRSFCHFDMIANLYFKKYNLMNFSRFEFEKTSRRNVAIIVICNSLFFERLF